MSDSGLHEEEKKHIAIAQQNNNTFEKFISKYGNRTIEQISNADKRYERNSFTRIARYGTRRSYAL
jgi:hypothetical protein